MPAFLASAEAVTGQGTRSFLLTLVLVVCYLSVISISCTPRTSAVIAVHLYGHPCDMGAPARLSDKHNLKIIETAPGTGAQYCGLSVGGIGDVAAFGLSW